MAADVVADTAEHVDWKRLQPGSIVEIARHWRASCAARSYGEGCDVLRETSVVGSQRAYLVALLSQKPKAYLARRCMGLAGFPPRLQYRDDDAAAQPY